VYKFLRSDYPYTTCFVKVAAHLQFKSLSLSLYPLAIENILFCNPLAANVLVFCREIWLPLLNGHIKQKIPEILNVIENHR
jgi:hypothetical protein